MRNTSSDAHYMRKALEEAAACLEHGDVPVGAVAVRWSDQGGQVVAAGRNQRERTGDPTAHAEILALRQAALRLGTWRLNDVVLYVTLEPCVMCAGALVLARVPEIVIAADDPKAGACGSVFDLVREPRLNHEVGVTRGVLEDESRKLLESFFEDLRSRSEGCRSG